MAQKFDSFDQSRFGAFIQSELDARGPDLGIGEIASLIQVKLVFPTAELRDSMRFADTSLGYILGGAAGKWARVAKDLSKAVYNITIQAVDS